MKKKMVRFLDYIFVTLLVLSSLFILIYYLLAKDIDDLRSLPAYFLITVIVYIATQLLKQLVHKKRPWYDWIYYIGIVAIILPLPLFSVQSDWIFTATKIGALLLLFPALMELFFLRKRPSATVNDIEEVEGEIEEGEKDH